MPDPNHPLLSMKMAMNKAFLVLCFALLLGISGCSRQQSDWEKTRAANTTDSYEQFLKKYPSGEFTAQAQARVKELYEERDWQKARDTDTQEAYQAFLKQYPEGKWTEEARIRVENFTLAQAPSNATPAGADSANTPGNPAPGDSAAANPAPNRPPQPPAPAAGAHRAARPLPRKPRASGRLLWHTARGVQVERRCRQPALGALGQGISQTSGRTLADRGAEERRLRNPVSPAGGGAHRETCARDLQNLEGQIAGLRVDSSRPRSSRVHGPAP